eukprot:7276274-Pyramimonas_sp.AAC.1
MDEGSDLLLTETMVEFHRLARVQLERAVDRLATGDASGAVGRGSTQPRPPQNKEVVTDTPPPPSPATPVRPTKRTAH